jgi:hypothetical protein
MPAVDPLALGPDPALVLLDVPVVVPDPPAAVEAPVPAPPVVVERIVVPAPPLLLTVVPDAVLDADPPRLDDNVPP